MKNKGILARIALAVLLISGLLGILILIAVGAKTAVGTALMIPGGKALLPSFCVLMAVMAVSLIVMVLAIPKKR